MSNPFQKALLSMTSLEAVIALFYSFFNRPLDERFIQLSLDKENSELIIASKDESTDGQVGGYRGSYRWKYRKANLSVTCPNPLAIQIEYPTNFRELRNRLLSRYQFLLEENEFSLSPNGVNGLTDDSTINIDLLEEYGQLKLFATANSGRFLLGTELTLIVLQPNERMPLRALLDVRAPDLLSVMAAA